MRPELIQWACRPSLLPLGWVKLNPTPRGCISQALNRALMCLFACGDTILHTVHRNMNNDVNEDAACPLGAALHEGGVPCPKDADVTTIEHGRAKACQVNPLFPHFFWTTSLVVWQTYFLFTPLSPLSDFKKNTKCMSPTSASGKGT